MDNGSGTLLTITFDANGITWGGSVGTALNATTTAYQGTGYTFAWVASGGVISYKYSYQGNVATVQVYSYNVNSSGELELWVSGTLIATLVEGTAGPPPPPLTNDIDASLFGTWKDNFPPNPGDVLTITFSATGITWGGSAGDSLNSLTTAFQGPGYTFVWFAGSGNISYKYSYQGYVTTVTPYTYEINGSGDLELSVSGVVFATLEKE